jgi:hypothetical protein
MASLVKKKKRQSLLLLPGRKCPRRWQTPHRSSGLSRHRKLAELVQQRSAPIPLSATLRDFGLPGALWLAAKQSGSWPVLESLWPSPRSGPGPAQYLLLAAIHRICNPGPKTVVRNWYEQTILASEWGFLPSALLRKPSGTPSNRFCRRPVKPSLPRRILSIRRSGVYSVSGRRSNWSVAGCWPTIPPTFTPTLPAATRETN